MAKNAMNQKSDQYRILEPIAIGGMAKVDLGEHLEDGTKVVFKRIRTDFKQKADMQTLFAEEQKLNRRLDSPHVVRMVGDGEDESGPYMIFEWIDGTDLEEVFANHKKQDKPLPLKTALLIFHNLAQGLTYLHELKDDQGQSLKLIHRDLSPGNILISNTGEIKIADFGIAKSEIKDTQTVAGELKGKFAYMAPEQTRGDTMDHRVDLFALGIVMWEALTGKSLFDANNNLDVVQRVRQRQAPSLSSLREDVPQELCALIAQLLEKEPSRRPAKSQEVVDKVEQILATIGLFDGHKRILAQLAQNNPRTSHFKHVPSGGATLKAQSQPLNVMVKEMSQEDIGTELIREKEKSQKLLWGGLGAIGILSMALVASIWVPSSPPPTPAPPAVAPRPTPKPPPLQPVQAQPKATLPAPNTPAPKPAKRVKPVAKRPVLAAPAATGFGQLSLTSAPWGWVEINGQKLEKHTPIRNLRMSSGTHQVRIFNPELNLERRFSVEIAPQQSVLKKVNLTTGQIR
ncbi:MAG: hypothetical protein CMH56_12260 [Myxococcales bacterium]|nr:hypothetical protein [Myxococcales bacterium]